MLHTFAFKKVWFFLFQGTFATHDEHSKPIRRGEKGTNELSIKIDMSLRRDTLGHSSRLWNAVILPFLLLLNIEIIGANFWAKLIDTR